ARRVGTPTDNLVCELWTNASSAPSALIESIRVSGAALDTEMVWVEFQFSNTHTITYGTTYWIVVRRSGTRNLTSYYVVDVNEDATYSGGAVKVYNGTSWVLHKNAKGVDTATDMPFRIAGKTGTMGQVRSIIEDNAE